MSIYEVLENLNIKYKEYEHPAVFTVEESEKHSIPGEKNKNLFTRGRKTGEYYLITIEGSKRLDMKNFNKEMGERVRFVGPEDLKKYLGVEPGSVTPFGLINDKNHEIKVIVDTDLLENEFVYFHPDRNTATLELSRDDFKKFLDSTGNKVFYKKL